MKLHLSLLLRRYVLLGVLAVSSITSYLGTAYAESRDLTFRGSRLTWNTREENEVFVIGDSDTYTAFVQGDKVRFTKTSTVTLGEDITTENLNIDSTANVTINYGEYSLDARRIELSGTLDVGGDLSIGADSTLELKSTTAGLKSNLELTNESGLVVNGTANLYNNSLSLHGGTDLTLTASGNGRIYDIFSNVYDIKDSQGESFMLYSKNNSVSLYFDTTKAGTGYWANSILRLNEEGTFQLVRYTDIVISDNYTEKNVSTSSELASYISNSEKYVDIALTLKSNVTVENRTGHFNNEGYTEWLFTSDSVHNLVDLAFTNNKSAAAVSYTNGGVILGGSSSQIEFSALNSVLFKGNRSASGGAIYLGSHSSLSLCNIGKVEFISNEAYCTNSYAEGGAIHAETITIDGNGFVNFDSNKVSCADSVSLGGALMVEKKLSISNNAEVYFTKNYAEDAGGAIYITSNNSASGVIENNGRIVFQENASDGDGGAIRTYGTLDINNNGTISFLKNTAVESGGAIRGTANFDGNNHIEFIGNSANGSGGAMSGGSVNNSNSVVFSNNTAHASGGAISGGSLSGNLSVLLNNNIAYADGGAISGGSLSGNQNVIFRDNIAYTNGGAMSGSVTIRDNHSVSFTNNTASDDGGAIYGGRYNSVNLSGNNNLEFIGNKSSGYGGAIYSDSQGYVAIRDNDNVTFRGNIANSAGGAIAGIDYFSLSIRNNNQVLFERNVIGYSSSGYELRSLYTIEDVALSARAGGEIRFNDSVYIYAPLDINADYTDADNKVHKQTGDIVFSGQYTVQHLNEFLAASGREATDEEITNSRTSQIYGTTTLHGGSLKVESQAILETRGGLKVTANSNASVKVDNASLNANKSDISFAGGKLEVSSNAIVNAAKITIGNGATLAATLSDSAAANLTTTFTLNAEAPSVFNSAIGGEITGALSLGAGSSLMADGAHIQMGEASSLTLASSSEEKIFLWLSTGVEFGIDDNIILFSDVSSLSITLDGVSQSLSSPIYANRIFDGDWVNENTTLHFEDSVLYVQNVNYVNRVIPEPCTTALSLLALAGLAVCRRRK